MAILYADASALVKLIRDEEESPPLREYLSGRDLVSSEIVLTEIPRAVRRAVALYTELALEVLIDRAEAVIDAIALRPVDRDLLAAAGALAEPALCALDAIHVASAVDLHPVEAFVTYGQRQAAAARLAGLRTIAPGA